MEEGRKERLNECRSRSSVTSRLNPNLAKRMQSQQEQNAAPLPPSSSSSSISSSFSSSSHQPSPRNQAPPSASSLSPLGKETQRNDAPSGSASYDSSYNRGNIPGTPSSPLEEDLPPRIGRRMTRQTSWNDSERRPSSYYDGYKSVDSDRRDERMASLEALRKRREIPVSVRVRSSSLGRDRASILSDAMDSKINDEVLTSRGTRNILDLRTRSSSLTRNSNLVESKELSRNDVDSKSERVSNSTDQSILEKLLHKREKRNSTKETRQRLSKGENNAEQEEPCNNNQLNTTSTQNVPLTSNSVQSCNGVVESNNEVGPKEGTETESSTKKKGRRISRFLRPDFFDTPREESVYAKKKDTESDALVENERKQREQHLMGGFLHSLEKRLDKLRGGEKSKKINPPEVEALTTCEDTGSIAPGCLTSTKLAAEVRKAKSTVADDGTNSEGNKKGSSRVDRAINSLLLREKGKSKKEFSESGLLKRAVGIDERSCPSKSRSSGELAHLSVTGGALLGKPVAMQKNSLPVSKETEMNGVAAENGVGGKFSSKVNAMLAMFRRNEVEHVPVNKTSRLRRTQSVAYDKSLPDDILNAIADHVVVKNDESVCNSKIQNESNTESPNKTTVKTEKTKKSSKTIKEKTSTKTKSSPLKEKKVTGLKNNKATEESSKEPANEKIPQPISNKNVTDCRKDKTPASTMEKKIDSNNIKHVKQIKNDSIGNNVNTVSNLSVLPVKDLSCAHQQINEKDKKIKEDSKNNKDTCPVKVTINSSNENKQEMKEQDIMESSLSTSEKKLDRTATQDSLDSSWSACSDGLMDGGGETRERGMVSKNERVGLGLTDYMDPRASHSNHRNSSQANDSEERITGKGELGGADDDSEESVGDRIRRKSFYSRFNEVPSRRKSRVGRKSSASSLLYSASDHSWSPLDLMPDYPLHKTNRRSSGSGRSSSSVSPASALEGNSLDSSQFQLSYRTLTESKKSEISSSLSRDGFSPPPISYSRPSAIYRRSSTSPYQDRIPSVEPVLHSTALTSGLRPTSSGASLARSNSSSRTSEIEDESRITGSKRGEESGHLQYIPSPLSPSSSMSNSYHNGLSSSLFDEVSLELDNKRSRKFGVTSLADGVTKPSPTHRKYNRFSSYCSSDGVNSSLGMKDSGSSLSNSEHPAQNLNPIGLPPLGISLSNKNRTFRNSTGQE